MANRELLANEGLRIPIARVRRRDNSQVNPPASGVAYKVTSGNPDVLEAVLGTMADGSPAVVVRALVMPKEATDVSFKVEDNLGSEPVVTNLSMVSDDTSIALGIADAVPFRQEPPQAKGDKAANEPAKADAKPAAPAPAAQPSAPAPTPAAPSDAARRATLEAKTSRTPAEEEELAKLNLAGPKS
jgi:hypothetical protein